MTFSFNEILTFLETNNISYSVEGDVTKDTGILFTPASIRNKIQTGFYFLVKEMAAELSSISNSVILFDDQDVPQDSNLYLIVDNPQYVHYKITALYKPVYKYGIHSTAIIDANAEISSDTHIGPYCVLGKCIIEPGVVLLGSVTIKDNVTIKANTVIEEYCVIGATGLAWVWDENGNRIMQPQLGGVVIEEDCFLGTDITIVRGSLTENTLIGKGTVIAHGTKIGHGCVIGEFVHMANNVSIAGNASIKARVFLGSASVVSSNIRIAEGCVIGAGSVVVKNIELPGSVFAGVPAKQIGENVEDQKLNGVPKSFNKKGHGKN